MRHAADGRTAISSPSIAPKANPADVAQALVKGARLGVTSAELGNYNAALVHVLEGVQ